MLGWNQRRGLFRTSLSLAFLMSDDVNHLYLHPQAPCGLSIAR